MEALSEAGCMQNPSLPHDQDFFAAQFLSLPQSRDPSQLDFQGLT